jgi:hypothetical protein
MSREFSWKLGCFLIAGFWLVIALADRNYPKPFIDDMSYIGAAINLATHNVYTNPYCEMLTTVGAGPGQLFVDYMPAHNYFLAQWLRVFGISTASFHFLIVLMAFLTTWLLYRLMPAARVSCAVAAILCALVYGQLGGAGLRADAYGFSLYLLGCTAWREKTLAGFFIRNLGLALTVITFPNLGPLAMMTTVATLAYRKFFLPLNLRDFVREIVAAGLAYAICLGLFLLCIQGQLGHFLHATALNQKLSALGVQERFQFFTPLGLSKWVAAQLVFLIVVVTLLARWWGDPARRADVFFLGFCLAGFLVLSFSSANSASGAHVWAFACMIIVLYLIVRENWDVRAWAAYLVLLPIFVFGHFHEAVQHVLADAPPPRAELDQLRAEAEAMHPRKLYLDVYAVRELYDYRLPENAFSAETNSTTGWGGATSMATLPKDSVTVATVGHTFPTPDSPDAGQRGKPLRILGVTMAGLVRNPYELEIMDNR